MGTNCSVFGVMGDVRRGVEEIVDAVSDVCSYDGTVVFPRDRLSITKEAA